jgi:hypothetical protein
MGESQRIYKSCGDHLILLIKYHHGNSVWFFLHNQPCTHRLQCYQK